ncbi:MAG: hypothetical protein ABEK16_03640 [Candidatus Nanohalobium sp.]
MDKTIQLVVVAMIAIIAAMVLAFMLQSETDSFSTFLGNQQEDASCSVKQTKYKNCMIDSANWQNCKKPPESARDCAVSSSESGSGGSSTP